MGSSRPLQEETLCSEDVEKGDLGAHVYWRSETHTRVTVKIVMFMGLER